MLLEKQEYWQFYKFFPYVYGVINNTSLVMEILTVGSDCNVLTVYKAKTEGECWRVAQYLS